MGLNEDLPAGATPLDGEELGAPRFSWGGSSSLVEATALRQQVIAALQRADRGDISDLLAFARAS